MQNAPTNVASVTFIECKEEQPKRPGRGCGEAVCAAAVVLVLVALFVVGARTMARARDGGVVDDDGAAAASYVAVFGSSVARGCCAVNDLGWWYHLADALEPVAVENYAIGGFTAAATLSVVVTTLESVLVANRTAATSAIISLSLANEGLFDADDAAEAEAIADRYVADLRDVADAAAARVGGAVVVGSAYANDYAQDLHRRVVEDVNARLRTWPYPTIDFYNATAAPATGRWRAGYAADPGHPNDLGHRRMFEAIDLGPYVT